MRAEVFERVLVKLAGLLAKLPGGEVKTTTPVREGGFRIILTCDKDLLPVTGLEVEFNEKGVLYIFRLWKLDEEEKSRFVDVVHEDELVPCLRRHGLLPSRSEGSPWHERL